MIHQESPSSNYAVKHADVVIFLYRDSYYNPKKEESRNKAECIIAKQRNGPIGAMEMAFFSEYARFDNLENVYTEDNYG
ncbi:MAG: DnaB-like helicase C-terminal domain-containing protein [Candidatus Ozemobacteraceae bacterium]